MRLRRWLVAVLVVAGLALLVTSCAWGVVTDSQTGQAVPGAQVTFHDSEGGSGTASANEGGLYAFELQKGPIPARGMVTYEVTAPGYEPLTVQREVQYDDNAAGTWEIQDFALVPEGARYYNEEAGFSIVFPADWEIEEHPGSAWKVVTASSPAETPDDPFRANLLVAVDELALGRDLEDYFIANVGGMEVLLDDFRLHESGEATIDGEDAKWVIVSWSEPGLKLKGLGYLLVKGRRGYGLFSGAEFDKFPEYRGTFEQIAESFRFE